jgi:hypothetical protein
LLVALKPLRRWTLAKGLAVTAAGADFRMLRHHFRGARDPTIANPVIVVDETHNVIASSREAGVTRVCNAATRFRDYP